MLPRDAIGATPAFGHYSNQVVTAASLAIAANPTLDANFSRIFSADNHTSPEVIFSVPFDGTHTRTYGGTTYLVHAEVGDNMDPANAGIDGGWYGLRLRPEAVDRFGAGDARASMINTSGARRRSTTSARPTTDTRCSSTGT